MHEANVSSDSHHYVRTQNGARPFLNLSKGGEFDVGLQPLHDWALIEPSVSKEKTAGGLFIPDTAKEKPVEGKVLAVGKGRWETPEKKRDSKSKKKEDKVFKPTVIKPGDQVLYEQYATTRVDLDGKELVLVRESDVLGLVG
jgi:chaperonin GroES